MKAFQFRLDQVLRWRASQLDIEKGRLAAAVSRLVELKQAAANLEAQLIAANQSRTTGINGAELAFLAAWEARTRRQIADLQAQEREAETAVEQSRKSLVEADQRLRLLQNLRKNQHDRWTADWNRELEAFAAESFLGKLQLENTRARSSAG